MYSIIFVTCQDDQIAENIANILLKKRLAACINITSKIKSLYWWKGKVEKSDEVLMIIKTKSKFFKKVEKEIKKVRPYEVPEIISLKIDSGTKKYLDWIKEVTK
jgi:periplasmic divalent cation tolerance protein